MPRGHIACLCKNSKQFFETVFRVWNTKYLNNLVYTSWFFKNYQILAPLLLQFLKKKNERKITLLYLNISLAFTCSKRMAFNTSSFFLLCKRVNEVHNLFKSRSISNQTVNWRRWRESVWNEFIQRLSFRALRRIPNPTQFYINLHKIGFNLWQSMRYTREHIIICICIVMLIYMWDDL